MSRADEIYWAAFRDLCKLRCEAAGLGDTACMDVCGEAGDALDLNTQPSCGQILRAVGFMEPPEDEQPSNQRMGTP